MDEPQESLEGKVEEKEDLLKKFKEYYKSHKPGPWRMLYELEECARIKKSNDKVRLFFFYSRIYTLFLFESSLYYEHSGLKTLYDRALRESSSKNI
ncbi:MAG TPA: hypothetical protein VJ461_05455 [Candidatus Nanoarchaeia archaeon]|nr:hypothetical protein [Candidatus Nanoarchaeia archaeon]